MINKGVNVAGHKRTCTDVEIEYWGLCNSISVGLCTHQVAETVRTEIESFFAQSCVWPERTLEMVNINNGAPSRENKKRVMNTGFRWRLV